MGSCSSLYMSVVYSTTQLAHPRLSRQPPGSLAVKWVTRERRKNDRITCPWLILRLLDREAEILYVPTVAVLPVAREQGAVPFDVPGVELTHDGALCSFVAVLKKYRLD